MSTKIPDLKSKSERYKKQANKLSEFPYPLKLQAMGKLIFYRHIAYVTQKVETLCFLRGKFHFKSPKGKLRERSIRHGRFPPASGHVMRAAAAGEPPACMTDDQPAGGLGPPDLRGSNQLVFVFYFFFPVVYFRGTLPQKSG